MEKKKSARKKTTTTATQRKRRTASKAAAKQVNQSDGIEEASSTMRQDASEAEAHFRPDEYVVVGVGASAGGLEAYKQLLQSIPDNSGLAYVFVQHLDPTHESMMVELLSKYTSMPVLQIEDATPIQPNHVYMIPPNRFVKIQDGGLFLDAPVTQRGIRLPIDYFFHSLAEARKERAICIVLSGTGSDGADGLRHVKAEGGMTLAQQPETAEYDGMPRAAMNTGAIDFVLPIVEMMDVIIPYAQHPYVQAQSRATLAEVAPDYFRAILALLRAHTNHDFSRYKKGTLTRRIDRRMGIRQISKPADYLKLLREDSEELRNLFKDVLIGVTRFFRDANAWEELARALTQAILQKRDEEPFRIWAPGCATGEEAYSIAMLLMEQQQRHNRRLDIQVFATDIDVDAIEAARLGIYPESAVKDLTDARTNMFFQREGDKLRVRKKLREMCIFAAQNLLSDPPFSNLDLICCRNLLIYLEPDVQRRVFNLLHFALKPSGLLFLGTSESPGRRKELFEVVSQASRIYRKVGESKPGSGEFPIDKGPARRPSDSALEADLAPTPAISMVEVSKNALLEAYAPASVIVNHRGLIQYIHGSVRNYLDLPAGEPELDVCAMALEGLKAKMRTSFQQARSSNQTISIVAPRVRRNGGYVAVRIRVHPLPTAKDRGPSYLVSFVDEGPAIQIAAADAQDSSNTGQPAESGLELHDAATDRQLALELQATREDLQSTIEELESANEELKASNEEVMSMNEELQSTNEELETSREELQSLNEELSTVNNQLHDKVEELEGLTNDLSNLLTSTDMATLFLDNDLRIRRFTPATMRLMSLLDTDVGRPLSDLSPRVDDPDLAVDAKAVLQKLTPVEKEVGNGGGHHYMRRITPFRTADNKIEGVVVTFSDVTGLKDAASRVEFRERQQAVIAQLGRAALTGTSLEALFDRAVRDVAETLSVDYCKLLQLMPNRREMLLVAGVGWQEGLVGAAIVPSGSNSQAGYTLQTSAPVIVEDLRKEKRFSGPELLTQHEVVSGISVIIGPEREPWGALGAHARRRIDFTIDDANFIQAMANVLWEAVQRERSEAAVRESELLVRTIAENSTQALIMMDDQGYCTYCNTAWLEMTGYDADEIRAKPLHDLVHHHYPDGRPYPRSECPIDRALPENVEVKAHEDVFFRKNGESFPVVCAAGPIFDHGQPISTVIEVRDMSEIRQAERAVMESEERLRLAARMADFGTYYVDVESGAVVLSSELKPILGLAPDTAVSMRVGELLEFVHEADRERVAEKIQASLDPAGDGEFHDEYRIVRPDGADRWLLMHGRTVFRGRGADRGPLRAAGVALDITERRIVEEELKEARQAADAANEAKSAFLANMSHEIRTPMTAILGYADVLHARLADPDAQACIRTIKENGAYLCEILDDILDLSKIEAGKLAVHREPCSIVEILADIRSLMTVRATEKSLTLAIEFDGQIPETIETDRKLLRQILVNLVGNGVKFTERGGVRIVTRCLADQERLEFAIIDTGIGIDEQQVDTLFLPFEQLDNSFTRTAGGSGLGLSISKALVEALGGELTVESVVDEGSLFRVTLATGSLQNVTWITPDPSALREAHDGATTEALPQLSARILVADDRPEIRYLVREFVESAGGEIETAESGEACIQTWMASRDGGAPFDAILMDIQMPVMDGLEATRRLRAEGYQGPIIALTANAMQQDRNRCLEAGCNDFISKPINRRLLLEKLLQWTSASAESAAGEAASGVAILCVDDHQATSRAQKILLERRGHRVETAPTGEEALHALETFTPDVVFLDLGLGDVSGSELLAQLKTKPELLTCLFVCYTGRREDEINWRDLGFDYFLQKPARLEQIERVILRGKQDS